MLGLMLLAITHDTLRRLIQAVCRSISSAPVQLASQVVCAPRSRWAEIKSAAAPAAAVDLNASAKADGLEEWQDLGPVREGERPALVDWASVGPSCSTQSDPRPCTSRQLEMAREHLADRIWRLHHASRQAEDPGHQPGHRWPRDAASAAWARLVAAPAAMESGHLAHILAPEPRRPWISSTTLFGIEARAHQGHELAGVLAPMRQQPRLAWSSPGSPGLNQSWIPSISGDGHRGWLPDGQPRRRMLGGCWCMSTWQHRNELNHDVLPPLGWLRLLPASRLGSPHRASAGPFASAVPHQIDRSFQRRGCCLARPVASPGLPPA